MRKWEDEGDTVWFTEFGNEGELPGGWAYIHLYRRDHRHTWIVKVWNPEGKSWGKEIKLQTTDLEEAKAKALMFLNY